MLQLEEDTAELRRGAGRWLKQLREKRGRSQRDLATKVGVEYYTFISQLETGRGRVPASRYTVWATALGVEVRNFVLNLMRFYEPDTYGIIQDYCVNCGDQKCHRRPKLRPPRKSRSCDIKKPNSQDAGLRGVCCLNLGSVAGRHGVGGMGRRPVGPN